MIARRRVLSHNNRFLNFPWGEYKMRYGLPHNPSAWIIAAVAALWLPHMLYAQTAVDTPNLAAQVKELLRKRCFECHGGSKAQGGVKVLDHALLTGDRKIVVPRDPDNSLMYQLLTASDESAMP